MAPIKILFICHGNICRSPMAEYYMKKLVEEKGCADKFEIDSAAVSTEELGNPVYPPARRKLAEQGVACDGHKAKQMTSRDYNYFDYLIYMDESNRRRMERFCGDDPSGKIHSLLGYAGIDRDVADPWYTGNFDDTWDDVVVGCNALLEYINNEHTSI